MLVCAETSVPIAPSCQRRPVPSDAAVTFGGMDDHDLYDERVTQIVDLAAERGYELALAQHAGGWAALCTRKSIGRANPVSAFAATRTEAAERALAAIRAAA